MTKEVALTKAQETANKALATINPEQYVAAVYEPFKTRVSKAIESVKDIQYDIKTTAGMDEAKKARAIFREIRIGADKERQERKAPFLAIGKLLESGNKEIADTVAPYEDKFDADIKSEEKRKDDIKAEEIRKEAERVAAIDAKVNEIKNAPLEAVNLDSVGTQAIIDRLSVIVADSEVYQERTVEVEILLEQTIKTLKQMADGKRAQEQLAQQQKLATEESLRVSNIKTKIADIRNTILDGADIEESAKLKTLLDKMEQTTINKDLFQEFVEEATQARDSVIKALKRQFDALVNAEAIAAQVREQNAQQAAIAQSVNEAKPEVVKTQVSPMAETLVSENQSSLTLPPQLEAEFGKVFEPTRTMPSANQIVEVVARHFGVDKATAHKWLLEIDFAMLMAA